MAVTAPPSMCVPTVLGAIAVWIQTQKKNQKMVARVRCPSTEVSAVAVVLALMIVAGGLSTGRYSGGGCHLKRCRHVTHPTLWQLAVPGKYQN